MNNMLLNSYNINVNVSLYTVNVIQKKISHALISHSLFFIYSLNLGKLFNYELHLKQVELLMHLLLVEFHKHHIILIMH